MSEERIFLGVSRLVLLVPGARTLKDRRQVVVSLRDRVRHRFDVTWHPVDDGDHVGRQVVAISTVGSDARILRSVLDKVESFLRSSGGVVLADVDAEVFRWHPKGARWELPSASAVGEPFGSSPQPDPTLPDPDQDDSDG